MKIVDVTVTPIAWPAPHPLRWGRGERNEMGGTILQVHTDEGIVGLGDATAPYRLVKPVLEDTIKPLLIEWFEEPTSAGEREQYVREMLREREVIHVALSGGQGFFAPEQFDDLIGRNAVDIVQPDVNHVGGLTPLRKVAAMAGGHGLACMPHVSCHLGSDIITMATAHVLGAMPNGQWLCYQAYDTPLRTDLLTEPVKVVDGAVRLSDKPGLGIELDQAALKRFAAPV